MKRKVWIRLNDVVLVAPWDFQSDKFANRNFHFGVREHGMGAILNGMALHGGVIPYGGTFLIFSDYMRPAIRLAYSTCSASRHPLLRRE
jgi:transketolase